MKTWRVLAGGAAAMVIGGTIAAAEETRVLTEGHLDIVFRYGGGWEVVIDHEDFPDGDPAQTVLVAIDQPFPTEGGRVTRPAGSQWDFLGMAAGENLWLLPQASTTKLWPGFSTAGSFAEYFEEDPRLGFTAPFVRIDLEAVHYAGTGAGHFSLWTTQTGGVATVWMGSADGIGGEDAYFLSLGHSHVNWGFSDRGVYRVELRASAFLGNDGGSPPAGADQVVSGVESITFAVGTFATWKARYYSPAELVDVNPEDGLPEVAHALSDTDHDGVALLLEYAFNLSPSLADAEVLEPDTGVRGLPSTRLEEVAGEQRLVVEYVRRRAETNPQITYTPEFTADPGAGWTTLGTETATPIDGDWERVRFEDYLPFGSSPLRLGRIRIDLQ